RIGHLGDNEHSYNFQTEGWPFAIGDPAGPVYPGDAIPASIKNQVGYRQMNTLISGWNGTSFGETQIGTKQNTWTAIGTSTYNGQTNQGYNSMINSYWGYTQFFQNFYCTGNADVARLFWTDPTIPNYREQAYAKDAMFCYGGVNNPIQKPLQS